MRCDESHNDKPKVLLYWLRQAGLILIFPSGVIYQNQTGGYNCDQRCEEGVFVPLWDMPVVDKHFKTNLKLLLDELAQLFPGYSVNPLSQDIADKIDNLLRNYLPLKGITVNRDRLNDSDEAWVYVNVEPEEQADYEGFGECKGVLTWPNSD